MYDLGREEAHEVAEWLKSNYNVSNVRIVSSRGWKIAFEYELDGYQVDAEIHEHIEERNIPIR